MRHHGWLFSFLISVTSSIGLSAGLSAAENTFQTRGDDDCGNSRGSGCRSLVF